MNKNVCPACGKEAAQHFIEVPSEFPGGYQDVTYHCDACGASGVLKCQMLNGTVIDVPPDQQRIAYMRPMGNA